MTRVHDHVVPAALQYRLVLQMFTFMAFIIANVANVMAQNLGIPQEGIDTFRSSYAVFVTICVVTSLGAVGALALLLLYMRHKRMLCY